MSFEVHTYGDVNYRVEPSLLSTPTHDLIFWPVGGSMQTHYVLTTTANDDTLAWDMARAYVALSHDAILEWCTDQARAIRAADERLQRELYCQ